MNERDLRYLVGIADTDNLRLASERLFVTQPALTKCIDRLEGELGASLFHREGRHLGLTPEGQLMVRRARTILNGIDEARREIRDHVSGAVGHVRVGAAATIMEQVMPDVLRRLTAQYPGITLELAIGMNDVLRRALDADQLDILVGPTGGAAACDYEVLLDDVVVVVASADHPLARTTVQPEDLAPYPWVLPNPTVANRQWLETRLNELGLPPPRVQIEVNSLALMPPLIARTPLLSFMSSRIVGPGRTHTGLASLSLPDLEYRRSFGTLTRRNSYISTAARVFLETLRSSLR
ncbi:DNA-binding transcriptional LysR family regulator [Mesorhizobium sp. J18]|uniref:LysR family transcriptional regulator n=1 Tax=Mesorhizobium sp. J18 TaxID=935263 RepID=UPI00119B9F19|nr:LysR family transcriptional regulator [Mesorhizobium sp. J18]TWG89355.1 DNA-binding transcriptional LysR family regulator [Mesorhizobium sp. J18]